MAVHDNWRRGSVKSRHGSRRAGSVEVGVDRRAEPVNLPGEVHPIGQKAWGTGVSL